MKNPLTFDGSGRMAAAARLAAAITASIMRSENWGLASTSRFHRLKPLRSAQSGSECQGGEQIVAFKIFVFAQDIIERHSGAKQVEQHLNRVSQTTYARLAMTNRWVDRDSREQAAVHLAQ